MPLGGGLIAAGSIFGALSASGDAADARSSAAEQLKLQQQMISKAVAELESQGVPSIEAQRIAIAQYMPELQGKLQAEQLDQTAMNDISVTPESKQAQMSALREMQRLGEVGLSIEDKVARQQMLDQSSSQDQARQASILQSMAERGNLDSGAQLAAQLQSKQAASQASRNSGLQLAAQAAQAKREALLGAGRMGSQMRSQDFGEQSAQARAKDAINKFNTQNRQSVAERNLVEQQRVAEQRQAILRQQEVYNKGLVGKQYNQRMDKSKALANAQMGAGQNYGKNAAASGAAAGAYSSASSGILGSGIGAIGKMAGAGVFDSKPTTTKKTSADGGIKYADGGIEKMGYEEGGEQTEGRVVPGESYSGDLIEDKINSGEMVLNAEQQEELSKLMQELKMRRLDDKEQDKEDERPDNKLSRGELELNTPQQEQLMSVLKGESKVESLPDEKILETPEDSQTRQLMKLLKMK